MFMLAGEKVMLLLLVAMVVPERKTVPLVMAVIVLPAPRLAPLTGWPTNKPLVDVTVKKFVPVAVVMPAATCSGASDSTPAPAFTSETTAPFGLLTIWLLIVVVPPLMKAKRGEVPLMAAPPAVSKPPWMV